jgi:Fe-S cluster assembly iron-binding protein IscA
MIIITPEAAKELRELALSGGPAVLRFDADPDGDGGYDCTVGLVDTAPDDAKMDEVDGVKVAFCGMAEDIFAGSIVGLNAEGELTLEMAESDCDSCGEEGGGSCSCGGGCCG